MKTRSRIVLAFPLLIGRCSYQQSMVPFTNFEYKLTIYSCAPEGFRRVAINRLEDGSYELEMSLVEAGVPGSPECEDDLRIQGTTADQACLVLREWPARILNDTEVQLVIDVFKNITFDVHNNQGIYCLPVVPCFDETFRWDAMETSINRCGLLPIGEPPGFLPQGFDSRLSPDSREALMDLFESLRQDAN